MLGLKISVLVCTSKITKFSRHNKFSAHKKNKQRIPTGVSTFFRDFGIAFLVLYNKEFERITRF